MNPQWPIFIPSKGRWESRITVKSLIAARVPFRVIVEEQELPKYATVIDKQYLLTLPEKYRSTYNACCDVPPGASKGSGPARNFAWDTAAKEGAEWHWVVDDNINGFYRLNRNVKCLCGDGTTFRCMEDFAMRFDNVAMVGPNYKTFVPRKGLKAPVTLNTRIYSCNLIKTTLPFRWRGKYNEDTDLSLRMLKAGLCTVLFNAFLQDKRGTGTIKGGNTDSIYTGGTLEKSKMIVALHPDVAQLVKRWNRWHHHVDYSAFKQNKLRLAVETVVKQGIDDYGMSLKQFDGLKNYDQDWRDLDEK